MRESLFQYLGQKHDPSLRFIDAEKNTSYSWEQMLLQLPLNAETNKNLAFLYLDNSVSAIRFFLSFLDTPHCVCLLSCDLDPALKSNLEHIYKPEYIVDHARETPPGESVLCEQAFTLWETGNKSDSIHPDLRILLSTSGTTGSPKLVKLSDANFVSNTESILAFLPVAPTDSCILNLPIHYSYGMSVLLTNIAHGGTIVCSNETVMARNFWNLFKTYACNSFNGVPYTYEMLLRIGFEKMEDLNLKYMTQAGGKLNEKNLRTLTTYSLARSVPFYVMYGQTEATARMSFLAPQMLSHKPGSIGQTIAKGKFEIDSENSELIYSGPNVGGGYSENREDLGSFKQQARLYTGDQARKDSDNYFYITGRLKRFIKLFGNRINLDDLEQELRRKFDCMLGCSGYEDKHLLVFSDNLKLHAKDIQDFIFSTYQIHPSVIKYMYLDPVPLTDSHKINYRLINETYGR